MKAYLLICCLTLWNVVAFAQNAKIDSLKKVIETTKVDTVKGRSLCRLCAELKNIGNYETGLKKGGEGLAINEQVKDKKGIANCMNCIGVIYFEQGLYLQALDYYLKSLKIMEQLNDQKGVSVCLNNVGTIYEYQDNYPQALSCYLKSLKIKEQMNDQNGISVSLNNIGTIYEYQSNYPQALNYYLKSLKIMEQMNDQNGISLRLNNIGVIYEYQSNYPQALNYYLKSLKIMEQIGDAPVFSIIYSNISRNYIKLGELLMAKSYAIKGIKVAQEIQHMEPMKLGAEASYQADSALGNWKSAFEYHKLFKQYSDSLHNEDKAKEFGRIESKYQFEKEAEEAKRKQAEVQRKEQEATERRNNLQYLSIFAGLMVLFGGLAFVGKLKIPARVLDIALFAALLILFEFLLVLFDPFLDQYTGGIPIQKLVFNSVIALGFAPLHHFLEQNLKQRFGGREEE